MKQLDRAEISASTLYIVPTPIGNLVISRSVR